MRAIIASLAVAASILAAAPGWAQAEAAEELDRDTRELMELTGAGNLALQMMQQMLEPMRRSLPRVPSEFWERFMAKVDPDEIVDLTVPIYTKHLTHDEIRQLLEFYKSPVGRKLIAVLPAIMQESMAAGQRWGEQLGQRVQAELEAEGYLQSEGGSDS